MIIIIRALPNQKRKERKAKNKKRKAQKKEKGQKKIKAQKKKINKKAMLLSLFPHLCFKVAP